MEHRPPLRADLERMDSFGKNYDVWVAGPATPGPCPPGPWRKREKVLVLERRDHIGGNAYDCLDEHGVLIHKYGPHIFHTNNRAVFDFCPDSRSGGATSTG